jgi:hypothetical protein
MLAMPHGLAVLRLAIANHQHERDSLQLRLRILEVHLLAAFVDRNADAGAGQLLLDGAAVIQVAVRDG